MLFNSLHFIVFFPIVVLVYYLIPHKLRWIWLLLSSFYFYMSWNKSHGILLLFIIGVTYFGSLQIEKAEKDHKKIRKKVWFSFSILIPLGILIFYKYLSFGIDVCNGVLSFLSIPRIDFNVTLLLPVGISFYTFQALANVIDVYRDKNFKVEHNFFKYALFISFFPQLVAGPIERSQNLICQFNKKHNFDYLEARNGLLLIMWGYFEKIVVADPIAVIVNTVYGNPENYKGVSIFVATILFAIQIYCDFSGYSHIAIGCGEVFGIHLMKNFRQPYFARSIKDFWHRWHISLSTWLRDYIYIPLGGGRGSKIIKFRNQMITFLISGLWHGASWNFVIWGLLHGIYQIVEEGIQSFRTKMKCHVKRKKDPFPIKVIQGLITFLLINFAWIFFRAPSVTEAFLLIKNMSKIDFHFFFDGSIYQLGLSPVELVITFFGIIILFTVDMLSAKYSLRSLIAKWPVYLRWSLYYATTAVILFTLLIQGFGTMSQEFIYFQF